MEKSRKFNEDFHEYIRIKRDKLGHIYALEIKLLIQDNQA